VAPLKYVCLSDLHLGAAYSVLSVLPGDDSSRPSPTLQAFGTALHSLLGALTSSAPSAPPPQLLLLGDILDLGLSPIDAAAGGFQHFVQALFPANQTPLLSDDVLYVPGNHDHFMWVSSEDDHWVRKIKGTGAGHLPALDPVTPMFGPPAVECALLTTLLRRRAPGGAAGTVHLSYPNFGDWDGDRCIVFHHGHFIEPIYRLMSTLQRFLAPGGDPVETVAELERENSPWIDFVWSTLGDTGAFGKDVETLYDRLQDAAATERFIAQLSRRLLAALQPLLPMGGEREVQRWVRRAIRALLDLGVERTAELERTNYRTVLEPDSIEGLRWYLASPVARQIKDEKKQLPGEAVFVFGHTHKPFADALPLAAYDRPVRVFNTGGWVLDEPTMMPLEGAAMVLVDENLNVVSVRLYNQSANGEPPAVHVPKQSGAYPQSDNPLLDAVQAALLRTSSEWARFTDEVTKALATRQRRLIQHFDLDPQVDPDALGAR
jgi:predicted phosphodiesterase